MNDWVLNLSKMLILKALSIYQPKKISVLIQFPQLLPIPRNDTISGVNPSLLLSTKHLDFPPTFKPDLKCSRANSWVRVYLRASLMYYCIAAAEALLNGIVFEKAPCNSLCTEQGRIRSHLWDCAKKKKKKEPL